MPIHTDLPVAVIGAGPVGLAAAAHLVTRGIEPLIFERGASVGSSLLEWGHVRVFSSWAYNIDEAARSLLGASRWTEPEPSELPTGSDIVLHYLAPLAALPSMAPYLQLGATVTGITREGLDKMSSNGRDQAPFIIRYTDRGGIARQAKVRAVIDASGTWQQPNPVGNDGLPVEGETEASSRLTYGIPDITGARKDDFAGKRVLVVGSGHSASNVALSLLKLREVAPATKILWALRRDRIDKLLGGGLNDQLPARGALGLAVKRAIEDGRLELLTSFAATRIEEIAGALKVEACLAGKPCTVEVDRIVVATGFRPNLSFLRELRVELDPVIEAPLKLAPLIDPNLHSCGTVPPHGAVELAHPEPGFYIVGSKSYGRAPTFLMMTGYEQVRSVVAEVVGDHAAAREVRLVLPETGVCQTDAAIGADSAGCCGGPAPTAVNACCAAEARAKGREDCGCSAQPTSREEGDTGIATHDGKAA